jgi:hypothetical protein
MDKGLTRRVDMLQWIGVALTAAALVYTGVKDYQKGDIKIPPLNKNLTTPKYPVQYCLMAYDPNLDRIFYLHENGQWYDYAPQQRRYATTPQVQQYQNQNQTVVGTSYGSQGGTVHSYGQSAQASTYPQRY